MPAVPAQLRVVARGSLIVEDDIVVRFAPQQLNGMCQWQEASRRRPAQRHQLRPRLLRPQRLEAPGRNVEAGQREGSTRAQAAWDMSNRLWLREQHIAKQTPQWNDPTGDGAPDQPESHLARTESRTRDDELR